MKEDTPGAEKIININKNIVPVPGTREPLHLVGLLAKNTKIGETTAIVTNPFYHAWRAGSISSGSKIHWLNALPENRISTKYFKYSRKNIKFFCNNVHLFSIKSSWRV